MRNRLLIILPLLVISASVAAATDFAVIVNPSNPVRAMTLAELGRIFKGKSTTWPTGRNVTVVLREPSAPMMKFVIEKVLGVGPEEGKNLLTDSSRKSTAPVLFAQSDDEIVKEVGTNPTAIGVVDVYNINGAVKVIKIDDKQPFDPGYVLKGH